MLYFINRHCPHLHLSLSSLLERPKPIKIFSTDIRNAHFKHSDWLLYYFSTNQSAQNHNSVNLRYNFSLYVRPLKPFSFSAPEKYLPTELKLQPSSSGFKLRLWKLKASTLTTRPPSRAALLLPLWSGNNNSYDVIHVNNTLSCSLPCTTNLTNMCLIHYYSALCA